MKLAYDTYYQTEKLFGDPYPELIEFFSALPKGGKVLDLGCGQGRDAIRLARLGFKVTGIDHSKVGIEQMMQLASIEKLKLKGVVADIYAFDDYADFDIVLLDSMFHFAKNDLKQEVGLIQKILSKVKSECMLVFCIQDTGKKVEILNQAINTKRTYNKLLDRKMWYQFEDSESGHQSKTSYRIIVVEKSPL